MVVAIIGSRAYPMAESRVTNFVGKLAAKYPRAEVVSGGARGPDAIGVQAAQAAGLKTYVIRPTIPPNASRGEVIGALMARNTLIIERADHIVAFHTTDSTTQGTIDAVFKALDKGKATFLYDKNLKLYSSHSLSFYLAENNYHRR